MRADKIILQSKNGKRNDECVNEFNITIFFLPFLLSFLHPFIPN